DGGVKIRVPVVWSKNTNAASYSKYDRLNLTPTEEITTLLEDWSEIATTIAISRREMRENSGRAQLKDLLRAKVDVAEMSFRQEIDRQLLQGTIAGTATQQRRSTAGNGGKDLLPIG